MANTALPEVYLFFCQRCLHNQLREVVADHCNDPCWQELAFLEAKRKKINWNIGGMETWIMKTECALEKKRSELGAHQQTKATLETAIERLKAKREAELPPWRK